MKDDRKFFKIIYFYITMHHVILPYNSQKKTNWHTKEYLRELKQSYHNTSNYTKTVFFSNTSKAY